MALLGRGGMGEVYRADDLVLGQSVALKFLPASLATEPVRLERFRSEVRLTRQVSHPNVCRVYDIGEADGCPFLAMEYIDGEDLSTLIRRIGRLPGEKAVEIARQICTGLAAAHEQGVVHRDLKPSNIMIDGRGKARLTDFGVAELANDDLSGPEHVAGTPAYMAPEQLDGRGATIRSDIYALGLVLYELFTGKAVYKADSIADLRRLHESTSPPTSPSSIVTEIDPAAERVILKCLEPDPHDRPPSAVAVMAALPGGDLLQAMLEAGETPSPELVAASGRVGALSRRAGALLALAALTSFAVVFALLARLPVDRLAGGSLSPDVLEYRAREIVKALGVDEPAADRAVGWRMYSWSGRSYTELRASLATAVPSVFRFWYRQHSAPLVPERSTIAGAGLGERVTPRDPPMTEPGMIALELSPRGELLRFERQTGEFPRRPDDGGTAAPAMDWDLALAMAPLDGFSMTETSPKRFPPTAWSERRAWTGTSIGGLTAPIRVEAASLDGRLTSFAVMAESSADPGDPPSGGSVNVETVITRLVLLLGLVGGGMLAVHNLRTGRGDWRGAIRLAVFLFAALMAAWVFSISHVSSLEDEARLLISGISYAVMRTLLACTLYVGLEPFIRRFLPRSLVSWSRLLAGRWRDPIVGRDVLVALAVCGVLWACVAIAGTAVGLKGLLIPPVLPEPGLVLASYLRAPAVGIGTSLSWMIFFVLVSAVCKRPWWLAPAAFWTIIAALLFLMYRNEADTRYLATIVVIGASGYAFVIYRFGLLALMVIATVQQLVLSTPFTLEPSTWFAMPTIVLATSVVGLTAYGFAVATAGQPWQTAAMPQR